jgi:hypothetical protein
MALPPTPKKMNPQVKIMSLLTLVFIVGIVLYTILPEGSVRGMATTLVLVASLWVLFKGG